MSQFPQTTLKQEEKITSIMLTPTRF